MTSLQFLHTPLPDLEHSNFQPNRTYGLDYPNWNVSLCTMGFGLRKY